jgi:hypothetical protein
MWTTTFCGVHINKLRRRLYLGHFSGYFKLVAVTAFLLCISLLVSSFLFAAGPVLAAASISLDITSGPAGTVITVTGSGFAASSYGYIYFDSDKDGVQDAGEPSSGFIQTTAGGDLPAGVTITVPSVAPGDYDVIANIPTGTPLIDASAAFTVTSSEPQIFLSPASGYAGTTIDITGSGFTSDASGYIWFDVNGDSVMDGGEPRVPVTVTASGDVPAGTTLTAPDAVPSVYQVRADIPEGDDVEASATFTYTITLSLNPDAGTVGTVITVTGNGFLADSDGYVWFDTDGDGVMGGGEPQLSVTSNATGGLPSGIELTVPTVEPNSSYQVRADIPEGGPVEKSAEFETTATTMWLTVTSYDAYGAVLDTRTVTYQDMESGLPVQGSTSLRHYHQGPTFAASSFEALWDPGETVNIDTRDYGRALGTDVRDLCDLVGGAAPGDTINVRASDNFNKWFDYEDIYNPEPEQGKLVVCWYNEDFGGYVPDYGSGMRLVFFAETQNPEEKYVFGDWDMHETLPPSRWHYYYDGNYWPSSSGLSVINVYNIDIHQPNLVSCDASGNYKDSFAPGETVFVKGLGLDASTDYNLWIQDEPVLVKPLDSLGRPGTADYTLSAASDPSGAPETVTTDASGDFDPVAVWEIDSSTSPHEYDIVADNLDSGTVGTYDSAADAIDNPGWKGFAVTEFTEYISFTISDYHGDGIQFGHLVPGDTDSPADWSGGQGAVTITVGAETNVDVTVRVMGTDFIGPSANISVGSVKYDSDDDPAGAATLTGTYQDWYSVSVPLAADDVTQVYYWITIPPGLPEGDYESTFYYKAVSVSP